MKVSEIIQRYRDSLAGLYEEGELSQLIFIVFEHVKMFSKIDLAIKRNESISENEKREFDDILLQLQKNKPIQYILGYTWFYGTKLKVNGNVLIPRQETEELVDWILNETREEKKMPGEELRILDICTGSGCIAIALKKNIMNATVIALDVSEKALDVARENASLNDVAIEFVQSDILEQKGMLKVPGDIIVSNPPYVLEKEKKQMKEKELANEPHLAMFVRDDNPLIFYERIADMAMINLKPGGKLYFEINETRGNEVVELLMDKGFSNVKLKKDLNGKDRMIRSILNVRP